MSKEKLLQHRFHGPLSATNAFLSPSLKTKKTKDKKEASHQRYFPIFLSTIWSPTAHGTDNNDCDGHNSRQHEEPSNLWDLFFIKETRNPQEKAHTHQVFLELPTGQSRIHNSKWSITIRLKNKTWTAKIRWEEIMILSTRTTQPRKGDMNDTWRPNPWHHKEKEKKRRREKRTRMNCWRMSEMFRGPWWWY